MTRALAKGRGEPRRLTLASWGQAAQRSDLSSAARLLVGVIALHADPVTMQSKAGAAQLVFWSGKSRRWVIAARRELVDRGWVLLLRSRTPFGDEDRAVLMLRIPVDNQPEVVQSVHQGGANTAPPPDVLGGANTAPHEVKEISKRATPPVDRQGGVSQTPPPVGGSPGEPPTHGDCALGPRRCPFCRRGLEHPP